jgi:hypothetical protein
MDMIAGDHKVKNIHVISAFPLPYPLKVIVPILRELEIKCPIMAPMSYMVCPAV